MQNKNNNKNMVELINEYREMSEEYDWEGWDKKDIKILNELLNDLILYVENIN